MAGSNRAPPRPPAGLNTQPENIRPSRAGSAAGQMTRRGGVGQNLLPSCPWFYQKLPAMQEFFGDCGAPCQFWMFRAEHFAGGFPPSRPVFLGLPKVLKGRAGERGLKKGLFLCICSLQCFGQGAGGSPPIPLERKLFKKISIELSPAKEEPPVCFF